MPAGAGKFLALTFLVSMMPSLSALQLDCGPGAEAKEKTQHTLTCEGLQADGTVYWTKYDRNLGEITVATCDATGSCQTNFSTRYDVKRPNNVTSTLKILEVKRDETFVEGEWSCVSRSNETASCYVTVVFLPHVGECTMGFSEQSGQVAGRCEMHKVYPSPTCNWYEELEGQETDIPSNQTTLSLTQYVDSSTSQIYFRGECMLHRPLPVTAGSYSYKVLIIPGLVEPLVDFTTTNRVAVPAPPVLQNCPQDYVTDADANSCTCATSDLGSPPGSLAWYDPNNSTVLPRNTSLILALPFSRVTAEFSGQTYRCGVVHHTGSPSVDYVPKIAASPNKPKLSGYDKNKEYKVGETITLQCSADGGRPDISRVILQCDGRPDEADSHVGGSVISRLSFALKESENNGECECYATNGILTSERVTQRINERVASGKEYELEVWYVALPVAVVVAVVVVGVLGYTIRKRKYCRHRHFKRLDNDGSHEGSTATLNTTCPPYAEIEDGHSSLESPAPNSPRLEATNCQGEKKAENKISCEGSPSAEYSQRQSPKRERGHEGHYSALSADGDNPYEVLAAGLNSKAEKLDPLWYTPQQQHSATPGVLYQQGNESDNPPINHNQNVVSSGTETGPPHSTIGSLPTGDVMHRDDQARNSRDKINGNTNPHRTDSETVVTKILLQILDAVITKSSIVPPESIKHNNQDSGEDGTTPNRGRSTDSEGEANKQNGSDPEGQREKPLHTDGNTNPTELDLSSRAMKPDTPPSPSYSPSSVPPAGQDFVAAPEPMHTTLPDKDKEPASDAGAEHSENQISGAEAKTNAEENPSNIKQQGIPARHRQDT